MAAKLSGYFDTAFKLGSFKATMRLAMLTATPQKKAVELPDSPENIKKFEDALREIRKEFS